MSKIENIHIRLKTARLAAGFKTATAFCSEFNIPISTYNMHETGRRMLMPNIAEKYSEFLAINTAWLMTGLGLPSPNYYESKNNAELTETEYLNLFNYKGNRKISSQNNASPPQLERINPTIFSKIISEISSAVKERAMNIDFQIISNKAVEIYNDITQTSNTHDDQLMMINLAITIFKRQLQTQEQHQINPRKVINK